MDSKQLLPILVIVLIGLGLYMFVGPGANRAPTGMVAPAANVAPVTTQPSAVAVERLLLGGADKASPYKMGVVVNNVGAGVELVQLNVKEYAETYKREKPLTLLKAEEWTQRPFTTTRVMIDGAVWDLRGQAWKVEKPEKPDEVRLSVTLGDGAGHDLARIEKVFRIDQTSYNMTVEHIVHNLTGGTGKATPHGAETQNAATQEAGKNLEVAIEQLGATSLPNDSMQTDMRTYEGAAYDPANKIIKPDAKMLGQPKLEGINKELAGINQEIARVSGQLAVTKGEEERKKLQQELDKWTKDKEAKEKEATLGEFTGTNHLVWTAASNRFFTVITHPLGRPGAVKEELNGGPSIPMPDFMEDARVELVGVHTGLGKTEPDQTLGVVYRGRPVKVGAGEKTTLALTHYIGPKSPEILRGNYHAAPGTPEHDYAFYNYIGVIRFSQGGCYGPCTFDWLATGILWLLGIIQHYVTFKNYGVAIIVLVLVVRLLLHPLTRYSQVNMAVMQKKMAKIQPEIEKVKKKYEKDKAKQQQELMAVYKEHNVNPAGGIMGCLPLLLQLPIWAALYSGLAADIHLRQAVFIPGWINDLTNPDTVFPRALPMVGHPLFTLPLVGAVYGLNLLPLLLAVVFFLQMKVQMRSMPKPVDEQQAQTQKWSQYMMLIFPVFMYNVPSGLNLYIFASTIGGLFDSWVVRRHLRAQGILPGVTPAK